jgi:glycosyltransferase involved in cell wall biosynthesis
MPIYNSETTLRSAIESILGQSYNNLFLILVDDASTDSSIDIAKEYLKDRRVKLFANSKNMGAYYCRNTGLFFARKMKWGYFTTHDADDISFEDRYRTLIRLLSKHSHVNGMQDMFERIEIATGKTISAKLTLAHAVFKRQVFEVLGYFDKTRFGGDWEHWNRLQYWNQRHEMQSKSYSHILGESYIGENNLTVLIPEDSEKRKSYVKKSQNKLIRNKLKTIYYNFVIDPEITREVSYE